MVVKKKAPSPKALDGKAVAVPRWVGQLRAANGNEHRVSVVRNKSHMFLLSQKMPLLHRHPSGKWRNITREARSSQVRRRMLKGISGHALGIQNLKPYHGARSHILTRATDHPATLLDVALSNRPITRLGYQKHTCLEGDQQKTHVKHVSSSRITQVATGTLTQSASCSIVDARNIQ